MFQRPFVLRLAIGLVLALTCASPIPSGAADTKPTHAHGTPAASATTAPLLDNLGDHHRAITTKNPDVQRWFDQGLRLVWAFNLDEAQRAFEQAIQLDPQCASCYWGAAMSLGPHINLPAQSERTVAAHRMAQQALQRVASASAVERALIEAVVKRYSDPAPTDPAVQLGLDSSYAAAMAEVAKRFPDDNDVVALAAEAAMNVHPWDYWKDGAPQPWTPAILAMIDTVLARDPNHPGANHYHIHMVEASPNPERALKSADVLVNAMPGAGHMVHMPSHIYERLGRYDASAEANRRAVESDKVYAAKAKPQGFYHMYIAHNHHFLAWTSMKQGKSALAMRKARDTAGIIPVEMLHAMPGMDVFPSAVPAVLVRFERWDEILAEKPPSPALPYLNAMWHYARCFAHLAKGNLERAAAERDSVAAIEKAAPPELYEGLNPARSLLAIARGELDGRLAEKRGDLAGAVAALEEAVKQDAALRYDEPHDWFNLIRVTLGGVLLRAGRGSQAEAVFRDDLTRNPGMGWSLFGLAESLRLQKKGADAADADQKLKQSWSEADYALTVAKL